MKPEELKAKRAQLGMSQSQLASRLGVTTSTLARWEQGQLKIGNPIMLSLAIQAIELSDVTLKTDSPAPVKGKKAKLSKR